MGIKGLNPFLKKHCPDAFVELPYSYFKHKRIAIDSDNVLRKLMSRAHKEVVNDTDVTVTELEREKIIKRWVHHIKNFILDFLKHHITLIFIFDGAYVEDKIETQQKRRDEKRKRVKDADDLKTKIFELHELERTPAMLKELRKKMQYLSYIDKDEKEYVKGLLSAAGFPIIVANGDGEQLCAMLCISGKVKAVYSTDTDMLAYGSPLSITDSAGYVYDNKNGTRELYLKCTKFIPILAKLNIEYPTFLDLCIMSGCDYNSNIYRVGISSSYKMLQKCGKIEDIPDKYNDKKDCLNYEKCRNYFKYVPCEESSQDEIILNINLDLSDARDRLEMYDAADWLNDLVPIYKSFHAPNDLCVVRKPSLAQSKMYLERNSQNKSEEKTLADKVKEETMNLTQHLNSLQLKNYKK